MNNNKANINIIEEKITDMPTDKQLKQHTRWIASQSKVPIINTIFGAYLNEYCHVLEGYDAKYLQTLTK